MENNMFCFQCQETAKGFGCTLKGVCGKNATTARTMDLLLFVVRGISVVADQLRRIYPPLKKSGQFHCRRLILYHYQCQFR